MDEKSNVVPIEEARDNKTGRFVKGKSGNPAGVSKKQQAVNSLTREQKAVLQSLFTAKVPSVVKVLAALLVDKDTTDDNLIKVCKLMLEYGIGKPTQIIAMELPEEDETAVSEYSEELRNEMIRRLTEMGEADDKL